MKLYIKTRKPGIRVFIPAWAYLLQYYGSAAHFLCTRPPSKWGFGSVRNRYERG